MEVSAEVDDENEPIMSSSFTSSGATATARPMRTSSDGGESTQSEKSTSSTRYPHRGLRFGFGTMPPPLLWSTSGYWEDDSSTNSPRVEARESNRNLVGQSGSENLKAKIALSLVTIFYFLGYIPTMVIMNPYIYDRIAEQYDYQVNTSSQVPCVKGNSNLTGNASSIKIQDEIERKVSTLELYLHLTTYITATFPILLLGPITDKFGRKAGFLLPIGATLIKQVVYIIVVVLKLPVRLLYLAHAIEAFGGSFAAMLSVIFSVTSDLTQSGLSRSRWVALLEALQTLSATAGQVYTAQWMRHEYLSPLICALCNCCVAFLMALFLLPETYEANLSGYVKQSSRSQVWDASEDKNKSYYRRGLKLCSASWTMVKRSLALYVKDDHENKGTSGQASIVCKRRLCLGIFICTVAVNFSRPDVEALFQMKYPLCWTATKVYTFNGMRIFLSWVAILFVLVLMQRFFKMAGRHVAIIGIVSSALSHAALSLAVNDIMVYEAAVIGFMTRSVIPMLRSTLSSLVDYTDQGAMYSSLSCIESLGTSIFATAANRIYYATLSSWAGEIFMIFACVMIVALTLLIILNIMFAKEAGQQNNTKRDMNIQEDTDD